MASNPTPKVAASALAQGSAKPEPGLEIARALAQVALDIDPLQARDKLRAFLKATDPPAPPPPPVVVVVKPYDD